MPYVKRSPDGRLQAVSLVSDSVCNEELMPDDPELQVFVGGLNAHKQFVESDLQFVRVIEDVLELLIERGVIRFTDLPEVAQQKMIARQQLRSNRASLDLLDTDDLL